MDEKQRRRQSTLVFSTTKLESLFSGSRSGRDGAESPTSSMSQSNNNRSLKPPPSSTPISNSNSSQNNNRNSIGLWSGSKSASSTPNLGNVDATATLNITNGTSSVRSRHHHSNSNSHSHHAPHHYHGHNSTHNSDSSHYPQDTTHSASPALSRQQHSHQHGTGEGSEASMDSSESASFQQRRKRSESTGGIKNTAGNFTRIVKKSSSNFLRKFVRGFDDREAPPTPMMPSSKNSSSVRSSPSTTVSRSGYGTVGRSTPAPELLTLSLSLGQDTATDSCSPITTRIGPLDTPPPLSPLLSQELAQFSSTLDPPLVLSKDIPPLSSTSTQKSNVESWLRSTDDSGTATGLGIFSAAELASSLAILSQDQKDKGPKGDNEEDDDDNEDDDDSEDGDESLPISISNRLSKLYENGASMIHLNQSQTSLYYSTKSNLSESEAAEIAASRRASLAQYQLQQQQQDALTQSLGLSRGNSIRFSQYSMASLHLAPLQPMTTTTTAAGSVPSPSSPGFPKSGSNGGSGSAISRTIDQLEGKPMPRRPVTMFIPLSANATLDAEIAAAKQQKQQKQEKDDDNNNNDKEPFEEQPKAEIEISTPDATMTDDAAEKTTPTHLAVAETPASAASLRAPSLGLKSLGNMRPATICVSPEEANKIPALSGSASMTAFLTPDMSSEDQREATVALAIKTAKRCFAEDETFLKRGEISEYLGTPKPFQRMVLTHYMDHFDFRNKRLDHAFRALCQKLVLKGETQEVDRILEAFAQRYVVCNPRSLLGGADQAKDVVHAITYSILLLNTDLHVVQQSTRMSRSAFVKNTLQVVQSQAQSGSTSSHSGGSRDDSGSTIESSSLGLPRSLTGESLPEGMMPTGSKKRTPSVKSWKSGQSQQSSGGFGQVLSGNHHHNQSPNSKMGTDAKANGGYGNGKYWQQELETLLKDIYTAVKQRQILLPISSATANMSSQRSKSNTLSSSPPTSPTMTGFGSSVFTSNRMSRLIFPSSSSSSLPTALDLSNTSGHGHGGHGPGLGGGSSNGSHGGPRRNSVNARTKQLRNEAIQRLNAQAQQMQSQMGSCADSELLQVSAPPPTSSTSSNYNSHGNRRHSIVSSLLSDIGIGSHDQHQQQQQHLHNRGPVSSQDLMFLRAGGDQSQHSSSSLLSTLTMTTSQTTMSTSTSTSLTTPSASQNSLASLQSLATTLPLQTGGQALAQALALHPDDKKQWAQQQQALLLEQKKLQHEQHIQTRYRMEGILWRKHLLERSDKKAQHRAWRQLLVVVDTEQGTLSMFRSDGTLPKLPPPSYAQRPPPTHHARSSPSPSSPSPSPHGDLDEAVQMFDEIPLQHTITNILPPPGYSSSRQHVFAVQLFSGAVYLFQTSSPTECEAWARTCNYWAARTSKEPLVGGVVNMEYGWGRVLEAYQAKQEEEDMLMVQSPMPLSASGENPANTAFSAAEQEGRQRAMDFLSGPPDSGGRPVYGGGGVGGGGAGSGELYPSATRSRSASIRSGTRGSVSSASGVGFNGHGPLSGDSVTLFDWTAPMPAMSVSGLTEEEQMTALRKYVAGLEAEMEVHQEHRIPMTRLFLPKSVNFSKAFNNWERRSRHLLKEMVKYQIYVECLEQSIQFQQQQFQLELEKAQQLLQQLLEQEQSGQDECQDGGSQEVLSLESEQSGDGGHDDDLEAELAQLGVQEEPL